MSNDFSMDLRAARRNAGLTQADCGHLLGGSPKKIIQLERGERPPTLHEICTLSLMFGRNFESLFRDIFAQARIDLAGQLGTLPANKSEHANTFNRKATIDTLADRLEEEIGSEYGL